MATEGTAGRAEQTPSAVAGCTNKTPATKVERVESEPRFGANIGDYSARLRLLSGASNKANFAQMANTRSWFSWTPAFPARPTAATKTTIAERNERKRKERGGGACTVSPPFFVFFRFFRLYSLIILRPFLSEEQDVASLQRRGDSGSRGWSYKRSQFWGRASKPTPYGVTTNAGPSVLNKANLRDWSGTSAPSPRTAADILQIAETCHSTGRW
jgi:hypothetical protein